MVWERRARRLQKASKKSFYECVEYTKAGGSSFTLMAKFDESFLMIEDRGEVSVESRKPVATVDLADFEKRTPNKPMRGDQIEARGVRYLVHSVQPDDARQAMLILKKV